MASHNSRPGFLQFEFRVGIVGIGGLGQMAVKFAAAYGCDVTAFTSSESKFDEARRFGASHVVSSCDPDAIKKLAGALDLLLVTVNVPLDSGQDNRSGFGEF